MKRLIEEGSERLLTSTSNYVFLGSSIRLQTENELNFTKGSFARFHIGILTWMCLSSHHPLLVHFIMFLACLN